MKDGGGNEKKENKWRRVEGEEWIRDERSGEAMESIIIISLIQELTTRNFETEYRTIQLINVFKEQSV